jgi:hypothetical protein
MAYNHPSYSGKYRALSSEPESQAIKGIVMWIRGYPPLDKRIQPEYTPAFRNTQTLKAGK